MADIGDSPAGPLLVYIYIYIYIYIQGDSEKKAPLEKTEYLPYFSRFCHKMWYTPYLGY